MTLGDVDLPGVLSRGAPTSVRAPVRASGVWPRCDGVDDDEFMDASPELYLCDCSHAPALKEENNKVFELVHKEVAEGYMESIPGGCSEVEARFPEGSLAIVNWAWLRVMARTTG